MVNRISARIIADSLNEYGDRITTYVLVFPRIVLAEFNTHRALSKNSASSRAIPFKTMLDKVINEPFVPIAFQKEHKGMQGNSYFTNDEVMLNADAYYPALDHVEQLWLEARDAAVIKARVLSSVGVTKQLANRLLEPFLYHTVICTGTEWENFFALRAHPAAEIHIADLAEKMLVAYNDSSPQQLKGGEWHIPFGDTFDHERLKQAIYKFADEQEDKEKLLPTAEEFRVRIATARCARVSYLNFEGKDDYNADIRLFDTLLGSGHMSPFEHCAKAMSDNEMDTYALDVPRNQLKPNFLVDRTYGVCGNFKGFIQYRKTLPNENQQDSRVIKK